MKDIRLDEVQEAEFLKGLDDNGLEFITGLDHGRFINFFARSLAPAPHSSGDMPYALCRYDIDHPDNDLVTFGVEDYYFAPLSFRISDADDISLRAYFHSCGEPNVFNVPDKEFIDLFFTVCVGPKDSSPPKGSFPFDRYDWDACHRQAAMLLSVREDGSFRHNGFAFRNGYRSYDIRRT